VTHSFSLFRIYSTSDSFTYSSTGATPSVHLVLMDVACAITSASFGVMGGYVTVLTSMGSFICVFSLLQATDTNSLVGR
jgi:hypothetical protein